MRSLLATLGLALWCAASPVSSEPGWSSGPGSRAQTGHPVELDRALRSQLTALFALLEATGSAPVTEEALVPLVGPGSACTDLLPATWSESTYGPKRVRRAEAQPAGAPPHGGRADLARELTRLATELEPEGIEFALGPIEPAKDGWVVEVRWDAGSRAGSRHTSGSWGTRWRAPPRRDGPPVLVFIERTRLTTLTTPPETSPLEDRTELILGSAGAPATSADLARGLDHFADRIQRCLQSDLAGRHGIAVGDVDGDGRDDLYVCEPAGLPNRLLLQRPDGTAVDAAPRLRLDLLDASAAALWLDLDADGDQDLVLSIDGAVLVHEQRDFQGQPRFGLRASLPAFGLSTLTAADVDGDGDLDLLAAGHGTPFDPGHLPAPGIGGLGQPSRLYLTAITPQGWDFVDATADFGLNALSGHHNAAVFAHSSSGGPLELFVADTFGPLRAFALRDGRFVDTTAALGLDGIEHVAAIELADLDRDGTEELLLGLAQPGLEGGVLRFERQPPPSAAAALNPSVAAPSDPDAPFTALAKLGTGWMQALRAVDLDLDGLLDLVATGGFITAESDLRASFGLDSPGLAVPQATQLRAGSGLFGGQWMHGWINLNGSLQAADCALGLGQPSDGRAVATVDWDRNGAGDLVLASRSAPRVRWMKNGSEGGGVQVRLREGDGSANPDAIGARIELSSAGTSLAEVRAGGSALAQSSKWLSFPLPSMSDAFSDVRVIWPDGMNEDFGSLTSGRWILTRGTGRAAPAPRVPVATAADSAGPDPVVAEPGATGSGATGSGATGPGATGPGAAARADANAFLLAAPVALPQLTALRADGAEWILNDPRPVSSLVLLETSPESVEAWIGQRDRLRSSALVPVATSAPPRGEGGDPWPFETCELTPEARRRLELASTWTRLRAHPERPPAAVLLDTAGSLRAVYAAGFRLESVFAHVSLLSQGPDVLRSAAVPGAGRWHAAPPRADLRWLATRFEQAGDAQAARELERLAYERRELMHETTMTETALVRMRQGHPEEAEQHLRAALELAPDFRAARIELGRVLSSLGRPGEAVDAFERALCGAPLAPRALAGLARARAQLGLDELALRTARAAAQAHPNRAELVQLPAAIERILSGHEDSHR